MKSCRICGKVINRDGNIKYCKSCRIIGNKKTEKEWRLRNKKKTKEMWKNWYEKNKEKIAKERKTPKLRKRWKKQAKIYRERHPEKVKAHSLVQGIKLNNIKCKYCKDYATEKHHPDYSLPNIIVFVCKKCHTKIHGGKKHLSK